MAELQEQIAHPRILSNKIIEQIRDRRAKAQTEMFRICSGERRWTMCVPVQDDDSDLLFEQAIDDSARLEKEIYRLRGEIKTLLVEHQNIPDDIKDKLRAIIFDVADD